MHSMMPRTHDWGSPVEGGYCTPIVGSPECKPLYLSSSSSLTGPPLRSAIASHNHRYIRKPITNKSVDEEGTDFQAFNAVKHWIGNNLRSLPQTPSQVS
ncbi:TPA: hypothetical protein ACH3X2_010673 [Trebouxia sp. C0005]